MSTIPKNEVRRTKYGLPVSRTSYFVSRSSSDVHSYILETSQLSTEIKAQILQLAGIRDMVSRFDLSADIHLLEAEGDTNSIKIERVRELKASLTRQPLVWPIQIAVIKSAHTLTEAAQQALLKLLEEPGKQTRLFLLTDQVSRLLPTILSRCQLIRVESGEQRNVSCLELNTQLVDQIRSLNDASVTQRMMFFEKQLKDKQTAQAWMRQAIDILRESLSQPSQFSTLKTQLSTLMLALNDLEANVNLKLTLDHLALNWSNPSPLLEG